MISLNDKEVVFGRYPNGECNVSLEQLIVLTDNHIKWVYENDEDFIKLIILCERLRHVRKHLYIAYMPYSRMDRDNGHYIMSLQAVCRVINELYFLTVTVREPHSNVTLELLHKSKLDNWVFDRIYRTLQMSQCDSIFFPDDGARKRYSYDVTGGSIPISVGKKVRDFKTGNIIGLDVSGNFGTETLIVDDLCSRGGTFIEAAKKLKENGVRRVSLLVAYCEKNVFTGQLFEYVDKLYVSSDWKLEHPQIIGIV